MLDKQEIENPKDKLKQAFLISVFGVVMIIGLIRVFFSPYTNFVNLLMEMMLLDYLIDALGWIIESIGDILDEYE